MGQGEKLGKANHKCKGKGKGFKTCVKKELKGK
jgi:hypothetical protein